MSKSSDLLDDLTREVDSLIGAIQDAMSAKLRPETVENVVELALLRTFAVFEHFVEELFYLCILGDSSVAGSGAVVPVSDRVHADLLLRSTADRTLPFVSWLPMSRLLSTVDTYLAPGSPFERLRYRDVETKAVEELTVVRNAVAHPESDAKQKFEDLARRKGYPSSRAAGYLMSKRAGDEEVLLLCTQIKFIAQALVAGTDADAEEFLQPERPFQLGQIAPAGTYSCRRCAASITLEAAKPLQACVECSDSVPCPQCGRKPKASNSWQRLPQQS